MTTENTDFSKSWETIERVGKMMSVPGLLQAELKLDPVFGPRFKEVVKKTLVLVIENFDVAETPDDAKSAETSNAFADCQAVQAEFVVHKLIEASEAMRALPIEEMVSHVVAPTDMPGVKKEDLDKLEALVAENGPEHSVGYAKIDSRLGAIMSAGVRAAGGDVEFAKIQRDVSEQLKDAAMAGADQSLLFAMQMIGATINAITKRSASPEMVKLQIRSTIEMAIASKQAMSISNICAYELPPSQLINVLIESTKVRIAAPTEDYDETLVQAAVKPADVHQTASTAQPEPQFADDLTIKATSTQFGGNGTVN